MTKDWDSVRSIIRRLSVNQRKSLEEVKATIECEHQFHASTRAYRMKLKEWGFNRHKPRRGGLSERARKKQSGEGRGEGGSADESSMNATVEEQRLTETDMNSIEGFEDLLPVIGCSPYESNIVSTVLMNLLDAVLSNDSQLLERLLLATPKHVNLPIGTPFDAPDSRFFNHAAIQQCNILQHSDQTLLDIACALPDIPVVWVLIAHGAKTSTLLGSERALHNAIRNNRSMNMQVLLLNDLSNVNGKPETSWSPILHATLWNVPGCVRILIDKGANVNATAPPFNDIPGKNALQLSLTHREKNYLHQPIRERSNEILKMLLDAGADIHVPPAVGDTLSPLETFIKPWQNSPHWIAHLSPIERHCFEAFLEKGADTHVSFSGFPCSAPTRDTFEHQVLWHTTPTAARMLIDHADPSPGANGTNMLHEIVGSCPDAKRHPADTRRDIDALIQRGVDPDLPGKDGSTPIQKCIDCCPADDIISCLTALLDGGADAESKGSGGIQPFILAALKFEEPLLSQILHHLVAKFRGRCRRLWQARLFPIPEDPTLAQILSYTSHQILSYTSQNSTSTVELHSSIPEEVRGHFKRATLSVATWNFLEAKMQRLAHSRHVRLTWLDMEELRVVVRLRQTVGLVPFSFDQKAVMRLLFQPTSGALPSPPIYKASPASDVTTRLSSIHSPIPLSFHTPLDALDTSIARPLSTSSTSSNDSAMSFFVPTTTSIRWPGIDTATKPGDLERTRARLLVYRCKSCADGNMMTMAEYQYHKDEHWHTIQCCEEGCRRRFCVAERG